MAAPSELQAVIDPPGEVIAGQLGTWRLRILVHGSGLQTGGRVRVYTDTDTDWGVPQFIDGSADEYASLRGPGGSSLHVMIEGHRSLLIVNDGRPIDPGEEILLTLGDRTLGSKGSHAQTFMEGTRVFRVALDRTGEGRFSDMPGPPSVRVVGGNPSRLVIIAPSMVEVGEPFDVLLKLEDEWGNPTAVSGNAIDISAVGIRLPADSRAFQTDDGQPLWLRGCRCESVGAHYLRAQLRGTTLSSSSNPVLCDHTRGRHSLYWGDPHGGQLVSAEKIPGFYRFARDIARLDFVGYQRNGHQLSRKDWEAQQKAERDYYDPLRFVPLPGYEWSGSTESGGHHNVYFRQHGQPILRCRRSSDDSSSEGERILPHIQDVYEFYRGSDVLLTPHVGGNHADLAFHEPSLEPAVEVVSTHGVFPWFLEEALARGYRVGFVGGSDGYTGRPGAEYPGRQDRRFSKGGLTALYSEELTLEAVFDALKARRAYATTGARMLIQFEADGHMMGEEYTTTAPPGLSFRVLGTGPIERVELFRGLDRIGVFPETISRDERRVRITWEGASGESSYSGVVWDGALQVRGATIRNLHCLRFDTPRSSALLEDRHHVSWRSLTCGYPAGVEAELEDVHDAVELQVSIHTELITRPPFGKPGALSPVRTPLRRTSFAPAERVATTLHLNELTPGPRILELGPVGRRIVISLAPALDSPDAVVSSLRDGAVETGFNPYWLRVTQRDLEMAWTSPVFVHFAPKESW